MNTPGSTQPSPGTRDGLLEILSRLVSDLHARIERHEPQTMAERDEQRRDIHALCALVREYRLLSRDTDVDEMQDQLELLQEAQAVRERFP